MADQNTILTLLQKGANLIKSRRYAEALAVFDDMLALAPKDECAWIGSALSLHQLSKYPRAIAAYDQALSLNPTNAHVWNLKGVALSRLNRYKEAIAAYDRALSINPVNIIFRNNRIAAIRDLENRNKNNPPAGNDNGAGYAGPEKNTGSRSAFDPALNPKSDVVLYRSPRDSSETGFSLSRGTDLLAHRAPDGTLYFYLYHRSLYANETNICQITSEDSARNFIRERMGRGDRCRITDPERTRILEYFPGIFGSGN